MKPLVFPSQKLFVVAASVLALFSGACKTVDSVPEPVENSSPDVSDNFEICDGFYKTAPANLMILPIEALDFVDYRERDILRKSVYDNLLEKEYAPLSIAFTNRTLKALDRSHTPLSKDEAWNTEPFTGAFSSYCDAVVFISIKSYIETSRPEIDIRAKAGLFDSVSMELLFEVSTRRKLHCTDPAVDRQRFMSKAMEDFARLLLQDLPPK